jgi:hypothetical protein
MEREQLINTLLVHKLNSIDQGGTVEDYLSNVLRYGLQVKPYEQMTDSELRLELADYNTDGDSNE